MPGAAAAVDLSEKLTSAGVSEDVRDAIQTDVRAAMEAEMSSESRPEPEAMKETINGIFAEYGLNAEEFMAKGIDFYLPLRC